MRRRIYIAGSYSADNVLGLLDNIRKGIRKGCEVMLEGYSPFVPWLDYQMHLSLREGEELSVQDFYDYSMTWLTVSDAVLVLPNSENSYGTQKEIAMAYQSGIPVFYDMESLMEVIPK
jgi:hypothetical protein